MSGLAAILAGRTPSGAYHWVSNWPPGRVREPVEEAGWRFAHLEGARIESVPELHGALAEALDLPDHYGRNLDALADCLTDLPARQVLLWDTWSVLARAEPRVFSIAVDLLGSSLTVLLRGPGPETGLPTLD
ncbi:barstar family protein [Nocardioides sp. 1609]|uniref:barstar family protein n=1 Tax=Nocardioides sp. 1609 TaxID=2508327 RepID=UPI0010705B0C|nr:barstar family protein [Nocardioides sp. 1609]